MYIKPSTGHDFYYVIIIDVCTIIMCWLTNACSIIDGESFSFVNGDDEPTANMRKKTKKRACKALKTMQIQLSKNEEKAQSCWDSCCKGIQCKSGTEKEPPATHLTPELKKALNEGFTMIKIIAFPAIPAFFQDLWVYLELLVTLAAFVFAMIDFFPFKGDKIYTSVHLGLTIFSLSLALFDAYVYFIELGSCGRAIRYLRARSKNHNEEEVVDENEDEITGKGCFKANWRQYFSSFFELGRNIASELILYPLIVFDLFDFVVDVVYQPEGSIGRADFSLFVVGSFYLLLAVYIMRIFVMGGSIFSLIQISANKKVNSTSDNNSSSSLLVFFSIHILGQIAVHLTTVIAVAAKINNENPVTTNNNQSVADNMTSNFTFNETNPEDSGLPNASSFLWVVIVLGWIIPIVGVIMFFPINIYWMREFSIGFWVNMISLLQGASFAETVFGGDGLSTTKDQALSFVEKSQYKEVKKQLKRYKSSSLLTKVFYPLRITYAALSGFIYDVVILTFIAALMLTYKDGAVSIVIFQDDHIMTVAFLVAAVCIIVANIHVLVLLNFVLVIFIAIGAFYVLYAIMVSPLILLVYFPSVGILGYVYLFADCLKQKKIREERNSASNQKVDSKKCTVDVDVENKISFEPPAGVKETVTSV